MLHACRALLLWLIAYHQPKMARRGAANALNMVGFGGIADMAGCRRLHSVANDPERTFVKRTHPLPTICTTRTVADAGARNSK